MPLKGNYVTNFLFRRTQGIPPVYIVALQKLLSQVNREFKTMGTMIWKQLFSPTKGMPCVYISLKALTSMHSNCHFLITSFKVFGTIELFKEHDNLRIFSANSSSAISAVYQFCPLPICQIKVKKRSRRIVKDHVVCAHLQTL